MVGGGLFTGVVKGDYISRCTVLAFEAKAKLAARHKVGAIGVNAGIHSRKLVTSGIVRVNIALFNSSYGNLRRNIMCSGDTVAYIALLNNVASQASFGESCPRREFNSVHVDESADEPWATKGIIRNVARKNMVAWVKERVDEKEGLERLRRWEFGLKDVECGDEQQRLNSPVASPFLADTLGQSFVTQETVMIAATGTLCFQHVS